MATSLIPFSNIQVASNEAADYYTINRAFSRLYYAASVTSGNVSAPSTATIPYATLDSPGFVQFTSTSAVSGIYDNKIISSNEMNSFLTSGSFTVTSSATHSPLSGLTAGSGKLLNNLVFQYGYGTLASAASTPVGQVRITSLTFATSGYARFSQPPHILYQILDGTTDSIKFSHKCILSGVTISGADIIVHTSLVGPWNNHDPGKSQFYLTWLAAGV